MRQFGLIAAGSVAVLVLILRYRQVSQLSLDAMALDLLLWGGGAFLGLFLWFFALELFFKKQGGRLPGAQIPQNMARREDLERIEGEIPPEEPLPTTETFMGMSSEQLAGLVSEVSKEEQAKESK